MCSVSGPRTWPRACHFGMVPFLLGAIFASPLRAENQVDLELVIAADVSTSMDKDEKRLQQKGFANAMRHPEIMKAIRSGRFGRIAVIYVEWGGDGQQKIVAPWMAIANESDAWTFAMQIETNFPSKLRRGTSISSILSYSDALLRSNGYDGERRIINISSDGVNNVGPDLDPVRAKLIQEGTTINGLPVVYKDMPDGVLDGAEEGTPTKRLTSYFRDEVIGGPGAFIEPVLSVEDYSRATYAKLLREISGTGLTANIQEPSKKRPL